jgi:hypothetical protein
MNLAFENTNTNPIYIKLDSWDVYINLKTARNPQCVDDILRTFYKTNSLTLIVQGCTHMIHTWLVRHES